MVAKEARLAIRRSIRRGQIDLLQTLVGSVPTSDHSEAPREYKQWSCSNSMLKSPPMRQGTLPEPSASNNASLQRVLVSRRLWDEAWALPLMLYSLIG